MQTLIKTYNTVNVLEELYRIFHLLNQRFFDSKLEEPVLIIQTRTKRTMGTCSVGRVWAKKLIQDEQKYEITLSGDYFSRSVPEICSTLLHEMVHLYCDLNKIQDTSNNHVYHNKKFKEEAEKRGLIISYAQTIGWSVTTLQDSTKELIASFNINEALFEYYRVSHYRTVEKVKTIRYKYQCKCNKLSSSKELNLVCADCKSPMEKVN
jgi:hypothetical protein